VGPAAELMAIPMQSHVPASPSISLNPALITRLIGAMALFLILASTAVHLAAHFSGDYRNIGLMRKFNVDEEWNIPSFFSVLMLLFAALLLAVVTALERKRSSAHVLHWTVLTLGFLFMAADELVSLHEKLNLPMHRLLAKDELGIFYFAWVIPGIAVVVGVGLFFLRFLLKLPGRTKRSFIIAGLLYVGGVIGIELIAGRHAEIHGFHNFAYSIWTLIEESLEMAGLVVFIDALLVHLAVQHREVRFGLVYPMTRIGTQQS
jgi:hypothetical protein